MDDGWESDFQGGRKYKVDDQVYTKVEGLVGKKVQREMSTTMQV